MTDQELQAVITSLVQLTIGTQDLQALSDTVTQIKQSGSAHAIDDAKTALNQPPYSIVAQQVLEVADQYCDRLTAGTGNWPQAERDRWIAVCQIVTELTSSTVI